MKTKKFLLSSILYALCSMLLSGCFGGLKMLKVVDFSDKRVADLSITKKVVGKRDFFFFSTTKIGVFLEGNIQGIVTDYKGNPIEGVTVKAVSEGPKEKGEFAEELGIEESAKSFISLSFSPGISDTQGFYKIHFSLPVVDEEVDIRGKLVYNPGWEQQKTNLGKAYEPQIKESPFRLYYNLDTGFLAFAEGVRALIVQPIGEGRGRLQALPGSTAPEITTPQTQTPAKPQEKTEEDLFKSFDFGQ